MNALSTDNRAGTSHRDKTTGVEKRGLLRSYSVKGSVTDRIPSKMPTSYSLKTEYLMLHGTLRATEVTDKIPVINQLTLRQKDYPGLCRWARCNRKYP